VLLISVSVNGLRDLFPRSRKRNPEFLTSRTVAACADLRRYRLFSVDV